MTPKTVTQWCLLGGALAACSPQRPVPADVRLLHQHDQAYQRQVQRLQAQAVNFSTTRVGEGSAAFSVLNLEVLNPQELPEQPDTLRQRVRQLAHLVALDLADPAQFKAMNVRVENKHGYLFATTNSQSFIYPLASLR